MNFASAESARSMALALSCYGVGVRVPDRAHLGLLESYISYSSHRLPRGRAVLSADGGVSATRVEVSSLSSHVPRRASRSYEQK